MCACACMRVCVYVYVCLGQREYVRMRGHRKETYGFPKFNHTQSEFQQRYVKTHFSMAGGAAPHRKPSCRVKIE